MGLMVTAEAPRAQRRTQKKGALPPLPHGRGSVHQPTEPRPQRSGGSHPSLDLFRLSVFFCGLFVLLIVSMIQELYERASKAAGSGQWEESAALLERCCVLAGFESSPLNSQWMVAADRAGVKPDLGAKALDLAQRAWKNGSRSGALEFLQLALYRISPNPETAGAAQRLARDWPRQIVEAEVPVPAAQLEQSAGPLRIGHLLGLVNPTHAPTKLVQLLTGGVDPEDVRSFVYTTEWAAGWYVNWTYPRQSGPEDLLRALKADVHIHEARGNFLERARGLAARIVQDRIDVLVVHASNTEMVTSLVALMRPARRLVNVNHAWEMDLPCFDGVVHMFQGGLLRSALRSARSVVIPPASDMAIRLEGAPKLSKEDLGVPRDATVSGTFGNLYKIDNAMFKASLRGILESHAAHHHLIAGGGEEGNILKFLEESALAGRVHLLGRRTDIPSLLRLLDFYLASHPYPGALSEIEAMAAACPVISMRAEPASHYNAGAEVVALPECLVESGDTAAVAALASKYLGEAELRRSIGCKLRQRYELEFMPEKVVKRHLSFYRSLFRPNPTGNELHE